MAGLASVGLADAVSPAVLRKLLRSMYRSAPFFEGWSAPHIPGDPSPHVTDAIPDRRRAGGDSQAGIGSRCIPPVQVNRGGRENPFGGFFPAPARFARQMSSAGSLRRRPPCRVPLSPSSALNTYTSARCPPALLRRRLQP